MKISRDKYLEKIRKSLSREKVTFLIGARRVGKTTLMKAIQEKVKGSKSLYISFDDLLSLPKFSSTADFLSYLGVKAKKDLGNIKYLFLDEVQSVDNIEIILKDLLDNDRRFYILASGSGSFEIFRNIKESLMGRKEVIYIYPISFTEFLNYKNEDLDFWCQNWYPELLDEKKHLLEEFLRFGGYPSVVCAESEEEKLKEIKNIVDTWLEIDIRLILKKEDFFEFRNFLEAVSQTSGSLIKIDRLAQDFGFKSRQIKKYLQILQKSFLVDFVQPFSRKRPDEIKSHQKAYFLDLGIFNYLNQKFNFDQNYRGRIIENFVFTEFLKSKKESQIIKFWRTKNGVEIDFLIFNLLKDSFDIYEVKSKSTDIIPKSYRSFFETYKQNISNLYLLNKNIKKDRSFSNKKVFFKPFIFSSLDFDFD